MEMTAERILAIRPGQAQDIFKDNEKNPRKAFLKLAARWHPDRCGDPRASDVFAHIMGLRDALDGKAQAPASRNTFRDSSGKAFAMRIVSKAQTDAGEVLVGHQSIVERFAPDMSDIAAAAASAIDGFRFADDDMKRQMAAFLPEAPKTRHLEDGGQLHIRKRARGEILLRDLVAGDGPLPPVHGAWLCSGLMNIAAWLTWSKLVHGAISMDSILVDPSTHAVRLFGSWGFATEGGTRPVMLPNRSLSIAPHIAVAGQVATSALDLELVRRTAMEAMGASSRGALTELGLPGPVAQWFLMSPGKDGIADYQSWQAALEAGWGERKFAVYDGRGAALYANV